jgi:excisionase family DNA binding protein
MTREEAIEAIAEALWNSTQQTVRRNGGNCRPWNKVGSEVDGYRTEAAAVYDGPVQRIIIDALRPATRKSDELELIPLREAADMAGVHTVTLRRWIAAGDLTAVRIGPRHIRVKRVDVAELLLGREVAA